MPITTTLVGASLGECETQVTTRRMLAYAAAIGDLAPQRFDDLHAGFIAAPAMCVAIEWPLLIAPHNRDLVSADPAEAARVVHLVQDSQFHRPVRSGDRLITSGTVGAVWRSKGGTSVAIELRTVDASGGWVVTSRLESLYRGVDLVGDEPPRPAATAPVAKTPAERTLILRVPTDPSLAHVYTECAGIWNPIHTERGVAQALGLPDRILHGTASWALAGREIVRSIGGDDATRLKRLRGRFGAMVVAGETLELRLAIERRDGPDGTEDRVAFSLLGADGRPVIADGLAVLATHA